MLNPFRRKGIPERISFKREEDYHTHYIGKSKEGQRFSDIKVKPFQTIIDGIVFGLVPNEEYESVELQPSSSISFHTPWDGEYDT